MKSFVKLGFVMLISMAFVFLGCKHEVTNSGTTSEQTQETVTISYSSERGDVPPSKSVSKGYILSQGDLPELSVEGFTFRGWNKLAGDEIVEDTVITASWVENSGNGETEGLEYKEYKDSCKLIGIGTYKGTQIIIPPTYNGKPVRSIESEAFKDNPVITKVVIPESISTIGSEAFSGCTALTSLIINADYINTNCSGAFKNCTKLTDIRINADFRGSFYGLFDNAGKDAQQVVVEFGEGVTLISEKLFQPYSKSAKNYVSKIIIPSTVTEIGYSAFYDSTHLEEVIYKAENVSKNGSYVFENAGTDVDGGTKIFFGKTVKRIPDNFSAYENVVPNFTSIEFEEDSECISIGDYAFYKIPITNTVLPETLQTIGDYAFSYTNLKTIVLPDSLKEIGKFAFEYCKELESLNIPINVTSVGIYAFSGLKALKSIIYAAKNVSDFSSNSHVFPTEDESKFELMIKNTVESIPAYFMNNDYGSDSGCTKIAFEQNSSLKKIGERAFMRARNINSCVLPDSVEEIGTACFHFDYNIKDCHVPRSLKSLGENAFYLVGFEKIIIPENLKSIPARAFWGADADELFLPDTLLSIGEEAFRCLTGIKTLIVPESVVSIGPGAFSGITDLETAEFKCSLREIPNNLMQGNKSLKCLIIPKNYASIGEKAFYECESLPSIEIPKSVSSIGDSAFYGCINASSLVIEEETKLKIIPKNCFYGCKKISVVNLPEGITTIKNDAFVYCDSISSITIPESVECIENRAFRQISDSADSLTINFNAINCLDDESHYGLITSMYYHEPVTYVNIGPNVTRIPSYLITELNCSTVTFKGNKCKEIGERAFYYTTLKDFTIPSSVETIGEGAFQGNSEFTYIVIPKSVKKIDKWVFSGIKLKSLVFETPDEWYVTENSDYTGGSKVSLESATNNAKLFNENSDKYWYR